MSVSAPCLRLLLYPPTFAISSVRTLGCYSDIREWTKKNYRFRCRLLISGHHPCQLQVSCCVRLPLEQPAVLSIFRRACASWTCRASSHFRVLTKYMALPLTLGSGGAAYIRFNTIYFDVSVGRNSTRISTFELGPRQTLINLKISKDVSSWNGAELRLLSCGIRK